MFKIRVISTGEEGWVFGASIPESARVSDELELLIWEIF